MSFSWMPFGALAPLSMPPWPGSSTISGRLWPSASSGAAGSAAATGSATARGFGSRCGSAEGSASATGAFGRSRCRRGGGGALPRVGVELACAMELARSAATRALKSSARGRDQVDHEPGRLVADRVEQIGLLHRRRAGRAPVRCGPGSSSAIGVVKLATMPCAVDRLRRDGRHARRLDVDGDAVRLVERDDGELGRRRQVEHQPGARSGVVLTRAASICGSVLSAARPARRRSQRNEDAPRTPACRGPCVARTPHELNKWRWRSPDRLQGIRPQCLGDSAAFERATAQGVRAAYDAVTSWFRYRRSFRLPISCNGPTR